MDASALAAQQGRPIHEELLDSFAGVVNVFSSTPTDDVLTKLPELLVTHFQATRSELWLWDEASGSLYLTCFAGRAAEHRKDYARRGHGVLGKIAESRRTIENIALSTFGTDAQEFALRSGLTHIAAYPLLADRDRLLGVLAAYSEGAVASGMIDVWRTYAHMCGIKVPDVFAAQEQNKQITQLSLLFEATRLLNSTLDLAELLELILRIARQELHAERGSVFLVDRGKQQLWSIVAQGLDHQEIRVPFGHGIAGRVAETGEIINVQDAYQLEFFERSFDQKFHYTTRSLLGMPVRHRDGEVVAVIQLLNKTTSERFSHDDVDFLSKLSGHIAMALENARLHREALEKQRMEKELALARHIQQNLLPDAPPVMPGFEIAVLNEPCYEVGGDYYDFLNLGPHSLLLVVADVEGKGVSSALVMSNLQASLRGLATHLHSLESLVQSLNEMIYTDTHSEKYLSSFFGLVDTRRSALHYVNAGHIPPILVSAEAERYRLLEEGGTVIGLFPSVEYQRGSVQLMTGDILVCCTDGILEAFNAADEEYGAERLAQAVARNKEKSAQEIVDAVLREVNEWSNGVHWDDKVLMVLKVTHDGTLNSVQRSMFPPSGQW
ncbi:MAG TPA: GAF domain-containing SpoIIE family protein phosphatase [Terriglobales bacterium]